MSLTSVLNNASSGLIAAQAGLRTASDNIANVNTPGYVRKAIDQSHRIIGGAGAGTEVSGVRRIVDQFLVSAGLTAASTSSRWSLTASTLDNAQSLFGDPTSDTGYFATLDRVWSTFDAAAQNPTSGILKSQSVAAVEDFFNQTSRVNSQLGQMVATADARALTTTQDINDILSQISRLNTDISRASIGNGDATGAENVQAGLIDKLANLIDIKVQPRSAGGVTIRSSEGFELTGDAAATLVYRSSESTPGYLAVQYDVGGEQPITVTGGEMRALLDLRDIHLPGLSDQLGAERCAQRLQRLAGEKPPRGPGHRAGPADRGQRLHGCGHPGGHQRRRHHPTPGGYRLFCRNLECRWRRSDRLHSRQLPDEPEYSPRGVRRGDLYQPWPDPFRRLAQRHRHGRGHVPEGRAGLFPLLRPQ